MSVVITFSNGIIIMKLSHTLLKLYFKEENKKMTVDYSNITIIIKHANDMT